MIIATFENTIYIELAVSSLEQIGIPKERIFAAPLDKRTEPRRVFDSIYQADGYSLFDLGAILGTCLMLLGSIYGYVLAWGPIIWGIIGAVSGILLGILIKLLLLNKNKGSTRKITSEIVLMIRCEDYQKEKVEHTLWDHLALGLTCIK
ncbi:hypothetical protein ACFSCX_16850 [Bacillus salitolerans]|uniref:Uncharacterized protein n=1 Tax=Bacillus salitolerans TaxID=1437434 RepID=A0ABW4LSZ9_9BACI